MDRVHIYKVGLILAVFIGVLLAFSLWWYKPYSRSEILVIEDCDLNLGACGIATDRGRVKLVWLFKGWKYHRVDRKGVNWFYI